MADGGLAAVVRTPMSLMKPKCRFATLMGLFALWFVALAILARQAGAAEDPQAFIASFADEGLAVLADRDSGAVERQAAFRDLLTRYFDLPRTGRITLGRHWRRATPEERDEYERLFNEYVVVSTSRRLEGYADNSLEVQSSRDINEKEVLVDSEFRTGGAEPVRVQWSLYKGAEGLRILDVSIEGVSQVLTQRNEFDAVIRAGGGEIEALLQLLREQTADLASSS